MIQWLRSRPSAFAGSTVNLGMLLSLSWRQGLSLQPLTCQTMVLALHKLQQSYVCDNRCLITT